MLDGLQLDPYIVLGVTRKASLEEIHEAYRQKTMKHHPDRGGDEWAFRVVVRAYEILGNGRASFRANSNASSNAPTPTHSPAQHRSSNPSSSSSASTSNSNASSTTTRQDFFDHIDDVERVRPGIQDKGMEPIRVVAVEVLWLRYEVIDVIELIGGAEARNIGGSLNIRWPDPKLVEHPENFPHADSIMKALNGAFDDLRSRTDVLTARSQIEDGRFEAWISYAKGSAAWTAFKFFHVSLKARGLGVRQWTRDLTIPREPAE